MEANCNRCNKVVKISEEKFYTTETIFCDECIECIICNCPGLPSYIEIAENECLACKKPIKKYKQ